MATDETLDFAPNYAHTFEIDITPESDKRTWASALVGITECVPSPDETVSEDTYYNDLGDTDSSVDAVKVSIGFTGHRKYGDPAQDFIQSRALLTKKKRKTNYRWVHPDGTVYEGVLTMADLVPGSAMGEATAKGEFTWTAKLNTITETPATNEAMPTSITVSEVKVTVGATKAAGATVQPSGCNQKCHYAIKDETIATVDADGIVTGVKAGTTELVIKAAAMPSVNETVTVTVSASSSNSSSGSSSTSTGA